MYSGTSARNLVHLTNIDDSRYLGLNELLTVKIGGVCRILNQDQNCKTFVGGFVNNYILVHPHIIPYVDVPHANVAQRFGFNPYSLQRFLVPSYHDELNERTDRDLLLPALNAIQIYSICQVLLCSEIFDHFTPIRRGMCAFISLPEMGKTKR